MNTKNEKIVIYCRSGAKAHSDTSCADQEHEIREMLTRKGVDHTDATIVRDEEMTGMNANRTGFARLATLLRSGVVKIFVVADATRLGRSVSVLNHVADLAGPGVRLILTGDEIDCELDIRSR